MLTKATCYKVWNCWNEIEKAEKMLIDLREQSEKYSTHIRELDAYGNMRGLQLGIPTSSSGHQLMSVRPEMAEAVVKAHIADNRARLVALMEVAKIEVNTP